MLSGRPVYRIFERAWSGWKGEGGGVVVGDWGGGGGRQVHSVSGWDAADLRQAWWETMHFDLLKVKMQFYFCLTPEELGTNRGVISVFVRVDFCQEKA